MLKFIKVQLEKDRQNIAYLEGLPGENLFSSKGHGSVSYIYKITTEKTQEFWNNSLWIEGTKAEIFGQNAQL